MSLLQTEPLPSTLLERIECDVRAQLASVPRRLEHSLSVAATAESLADIYGVERTRARAAGLLHDWYKGLSHAEMISLAQRRHIEMGVDLALVEPLLHGIVAARDLPQRYGELPCEVFQAIERHTLGAPDMSPLDMVVFVADGCEPLRQSTPDLERVRRTIGAEPLEELFWRSFVGGISFVLSGGRYLYPGTIDIYNKLVQARATNKEHT